MRYRPPSAAVGQRDFYAQIPNRVSKMKEHFMAEQQFIHHIMQELYETHPALLFRNIDRTRAGIGAVFCCLCEAGHPVTAGEISAFMNVSTARVAVLLRKMLEKNLVIRQTDPQDARRVLISLSEQGHAMIDQFHRSADAMLGLIIDRIGTERMEEYISISKSIKQVIEENIDCQENDF